MQHHRIAWHLMKQVVEKALPDETPPARLKQVAILLSIHVLEQQLKTVTTSDVAAVYGLSSPQITKILQPLVQKGLIEREKIVNRQGRGHALALRVKQTPEMKALLKEFGDDH